MSISYAGRELQIGRKRAHTVNKTCVPCRIRKVKCDAAVRGLPCSSCTSRQCADECVLPARKDRSRKVGSVISPTANANGVLTTPDSRYAENGTERRKKSPVSNYQNERQVERMPTAHTDAEPDLLYIRILNEAVKETTEVCHHGSPSNDAYLSRPEEIIPPENGFQKIWSRLDEADHEYLVRKGVYQLPRRLYLDALIKAYFKHVHSFVPVLSRTDFVRDYVSDNCSFFLLRAVITLASLHVPADVLSGCGFASRSAAQDSFFSKTSLLSDFAIGEGPLFMLQGSILLCMVILDHPTDRDFGYWFHNAVRLATKLDLPHKCMRTDLPNGVLKMYRRIWWALYSLDIFHAFINTRRSHLLQHISAIMPRTEDDWEVEDVSEATNGFLPIVTPQQRALPVVQCELSRIFGECLSIMNTSPQQDPHQMLEPLDSWRKFLPFKMHMDADTATDVYYLNMQGTSYRFECILCRHIRRGWKQARQGDWTEWARQRLRSALLELDTIARRVLANGTFQDFPMSFVTTMTALLALHIESALDLSETDLVRSMARISISQTMLLLTQGREIPAIKRALPIFEDILTKTKLHAVPLDEAHGNTAQPQPRENDTMDAQASPHLQVTTGPSHFEQSRIDPSFDMDFLGFDFLDEWHTGHLDFTA